MIYCVDLDGTLVKNDMSVTSFFYCICHNPLLLFACLYWYCKGRRSLLKFNLARHFHFDVDKLPYNQQLIAWLEQEAQNTQNTFYLISGSTTDVVTKIATKFKFFQQGFGSSTTINLTGANKLAFIQQQFANQQDICYIGNTWVDLKVWQGVPYAVVVSDNPKFIAKAKETTTVLKVFTHSWH